MEVTVQDCTIIAAQIAIFLVLWAVLRRLWFEPVAQVLRERKARSEGAVAEAAGVRLEVERLRGEHAAAVEQARAAAQREVKEILRAAEVEHKRIVAEANADAERRLGETRARIASETAAARRTIGEEAATIARQVAGAVLGRTV